MIDIDLNDLRSRMTWITLWMSSKLCLASPFLTSPELTFPSSDIIWRYIFSPNVASITEPNLTSPPLQTIYTINDLSNKISCHMTSPDVTSPHLTSPGVTWRNFISPPSPHLTRPDLNCNLFQLGITTLVLLLLQKMNYLLSFTNYLDWAGYVMALFYIIPPCDCKLGYKQELGALALFFGWLNLILFLRR